MKDSSEKQNNKRQYKIPLPVYLSEKEIGLGDVLKRVSARVGISGCSSCDKRARSLNRWIRFTGRR